MHTLSLLDHFSALQDPRQAGKVLYPLPEVLLVALSRFRSGQLRALPAIKGQTMCPTDMAAIHAPRFQTGCGPWRGAFLRMTG